MRPLSLLAVGLLIALLDISFEGVDVVADWIGWLVVLLACAGLPPQLAPARLAVAGAAALLVSVAIWIPGALVDVEALPLPLAWAISLPEVGFGLLLALSMARAAGGAGDESARGWWRLVLAGNIVVLLLPPVVYGAGVVAVLLVGVLIGLVTAITEIVLCFRHGDRPWAQPTPEHAAGPPLP
ncbi:hypothetical protein GCM10009623_18470 [Nocardioides aestuarii]|uniref:DUF308 domain-containing protein n=1 Tax=Nocardioides aestuarii TaxID=252231 RepID=A0ABW4TNE8_9ACTN